MILIIEGCDGSGKTTLARYLSKSTGYEIKHRSNPKTQEEREQMYQSYKDDIAASKNIIWDRCFYSEMVYGPIMRDQCYISPLQMLSYEALLQKVGALVIFCTDYPNILWKRAQDRGESYITDFNTMKAIANAYEDLMFGTKHLIPIVRYEVGYGYVPSL